MVIGFESDGGLFDSPRCVGAFVPIGANVEQGRFGPRTSTGRSEPVADACRFVRRDAPGGSRVAWQPSGIRARGRGGSAFPRRHVRCRRGESHALPHARPSASVCRNPTRAGAGRRLSLLDQRPRSSGLSSPHLSPTARTSLITPRCSVWRPALRSSNRSLATSMSIASRTGSGFRRRSRSRRTSAQVRASGPARTCRPPGLRSRRISSALDSSTSRRSRVSSAARGVSPPCRGTRADPNAPVCTCRPRPYVGVKLAPRAPTGRSGRMTLCRRRPHALPSGPVSLLCAKHSRVGPDVRKFELFERTFIDG
jgi:hypothetical protein